MLEETVPPELRDVPREAAPRLYRVVGIGHRILSRKARRSWQGSEHVPTSGPALICANHISDIDPLFMAEYFVFHGRWPHFLAKSSLFRLPGIGRLMRAAHQIPVQRGTSHALDALSEAKDVLAAGEIVVIYPEGTLTRDPDEWPMAPRSGAARLAIETGVPVIPVGQWGANDVHRGNVPHTKTETDGKPWVQIRCGAPLQLPEHSTGSPRQVVQRTGVAIMDAITDIVADLRGTPAPELRWHQGQGARLPRSEAVY